MSNKYGAEVQQDRRPRQQQHAHEQKQPGEEPDWQTPQQPPLAHLATVRRQKRQLDGRVAADPGCFSTPDKEEQGVKKGQHGDCQGGEGDECDGSPATLLASPRERQEEDAGKQGRQLIVTEGKQQHIWKETARKKTQTIQWFSQHFHIRMLRPSYLRAVEGLHRDPR